MQAGSVKTEAERFWMKVAKDGANGCWNWTASTGTGGYGQFAQACRKLIGSHRWSYKAANGDIQGGLCVLHRCDNRLCVNPDHLFLGTHKDNTHDMMSKGRHRYVPMKVLYGADNHASKLSELSVMRIRIVGNALPQKKLAEIFGVKQQQISKIQSYKRWSHLRSNHASI